MSARNSSRRRGRHAAFADGLPVAAGESSTRAVAVSSAAVATAIVLSSVGVGAAVADEPGQGGVTPPSSTAPSQGGVTPPSSPAPSQGGVTPAPAPAPAPAPSGGSFIPPATFDAPPIFFDSPDYQAPTYQGAYNPIPPVLRAPRPVTPDRPQLPKQLPHPGWVYLSPTVRVPQGVLSDADTRNLNNQIGTGRARISTFYKSIGFPEDQAARTAASTTVGAVTGAAFGAAVVGIPAAVVGGVIGAGVGTAAGAGIGAGISAPTFALAGPGALIGLGVGTGVGVVAGAAGGAALGAVAGGLIGGAIGTVVGAGDPGGNPNGVIGAPTEEDPALSRPAPPNPDANQFEAHLDNAELPGGGHVDYTVTKTGDVRGGIGVGAAKAPITISAAQADAPFKALGPLAQTARDSVAQGAADLSKQAERAIPGLKVSFPQFAPVKR